MGLFGTGPFTEVEWIQDECNLPVFSAAKTQTPALGTPSATDASKREQE